MWKALTKAFKRAPARGQKSQESTMESTSKKTSSASPSMVYPSSPTTAYPSSPTAAYPTPQTTPGSTPPASLGKRERSQDVTGSPRPRKVARRSQSDENGLDLIKGHYLGFLRAYDVDPEEMTVEEFIGCLWYFTQAQETMKLRDKRMDGWVLATIEWSPNNGLVTSESFADFYVSGIKEWTMEGCKRVVTQDVITEIFSTGYRTGISRIVVAQIELERGGEFRFGFAEGSARKEICYFRVLSFFFFTTHKPKGAPNSIFLGPTGSRRAS